MNKTLKSILPQVKSLQTAQEYRDTIAISLDDAVRAVCRPLIIQKGFADTGLWPVEPEKVTGSLLFTSGLPEKMPSRPPEQYGRVTTKKLLRALQ